MRVLRRNSSLALLAALAVSLLTAPSASADGPKRKDSPSAIKPREVTYVTKVEPAKAAPGDTVTYTVTAKIAQPWHIYAYIKEQLPDGPRGTQFDFFDTAGLEPEGDWSPTEPPKSKLDAAFDNLKVNYHEDEVAWSVKLKVPDDAKPGKKTLKNQIYFQICDPRSCKPPVRVTVPDASLTVTSDAGAFAPHDRQGMLAAMLVAATPPAPDAETSPAPAKPPAEAPKSGGLGGLTDGGLVSFLVLSALGGLFAVLMPCVWPMIPITVNFFVKQGESKDGSPVKLAFVYCLAIIGIFTAIGLAVTAIMGPTGATQLGGNKWVNLVFGVAFIALGLSLLGLFEIRLPTFLLNASAQAEGKGGLVGVMFMAITLTITSFTCTAPVVGTLLVASTRGQYFYPVLGLLTFSSVLALPFFVLALVPGLMRKMPRSGDWMNAVKVVGGLVEIALAFKFLNTAEIGFGASSSGAWIDAQLVLTIWVVTALACGIYLLGLFRTNHDYEAVQVGPLRMVAGVAFLGMALFLAPALFGNPPQSKFYESIVGILPPDVAELDSRETLKRELIAELSQSRPAGEGTLVASGEPRITGPVKATSKDPKEAVLQEKKFHGVGWGMSYEAALEQAKAQNKPVLIDFTGVFCANCRTVEHKIMPRPDVVAELKKFVTVSLYTDQADIDSLSLEDREDLAAANLEFEIKLVDESTSPVYAVVTPEGKLLGKTSYQANDDFLRDFLREMREKHATGIAVARNGGS